MTKIGFQPLQGYAFGALQPTVLFSFPEGTTEQADGLADLLAALPDPQGADLFADARDAPPASRLFVRLIATLNRHCGDRRFTPVTTFQQRGTWVHALPTLSTDLTWHNMTALSQFIRQDNTPAGMTALADRLAEAHRHYLLGGTNSMNFLAAAAARKIPFRLFQQDYLIFGYGSGSTIFKSSITDRETSIGVGLARSKVDTNRLLKLSGLPVADQARVQTVEQARRFAQSFGYPVVLKPENASQGRGIYADIRDGAELKRCFEEARKDHAILLVEKHIPGDHYRVDFMGETLIKAVRRRAPRVTGDGHSTVRQLIEVLNRDPERLDPNSSQKVVTLDADLDRCLAKQEMTLDGVPEAGRWLYLKSISNLSRGGSQVHVEDAVHPDNFALCRQIGRILRLDVLGVDLLSPDLSVPWHENGAVICEVNAQPQLGTGGTEVYWRFLERYLRAPARVMLTVAASAPTVQPALFDTGADQLALTLSAREVLREGAPTQYFDSLQIAEDVPAGLRGTLERMLVSVRPEV